MSATNGRFLCLTIAPLDGDEPILSPRYPLDMEEPEETRRMVTIDARWAEGRYKGPARLGHRQIEQDGGVNLCVNFTQGYLRGGYILIELNPAKGDPPIPMPQYPVPDEVPVA